MVFLLWSGGLMSGGVLPQKKRIRSENKQTAKSSKQKRHTLGALKGVFKALKGF